MSHVKTPRAHRAMAPETAFAGARFEAVTTGRTRLTTWQPNPVIRAHKVAGSNTVKRQLLGYNADTLSVTVLLNSGDAYLALLARLGATGVLQVPTRVVVVASEDHVVHELGNDYVVYEDVTLTSITKIEQTREWWVVAEVVFEREHPGGTS